MKTRGSASGLTYLGYRYTPSTGNRSNQFHITFIKKERLITSVNNPGPPYRRGGPFAMQRHTWVVTPSDNVDLRDTSGSLRDEYHGVFVPNLGGPGGATNNDNISLPALPLDMTAMGTKGWSMFKPGNPSANVGQFLAELRDLPHLPLRRLKHFRDLGSEYLNVEFGWKPFLRDLKKMYNTYKFYDKQMSKLRAHAGQRIRRGGVIYSADAVTSSQKDGDSSIIYPVIISSLYGPQTQSRRSSVITTGSKYWFSGAFRYYVPDLPPSRWTDRATAALFGINPTPSLLYEVLPWSWLVDWFSSLGAAVNNLSSNAVDNLAADYAFVMCHSYSYTDVSCGVTMRNYPGFVRVNCSVRDTTETKNRSVASPFGFGLSLPDLSTRQIAILSALGISKRW